MACLFAARLSAAGNPVTMLGSWPEGLQALREQGVREAGSGPPERAFQVQAIDDPRASQGVRQALVLVKSWQTERAARQLQACLAPEGIAVTLQNGLGNAERLAALLGTGRVAVGSATLGATMLGPGWVRPAGQGVVTLGAHPRLAPLEEMLRGAGFNLEVIPDPTSLLWGKLVINAAINPLTALLQIPNGELLERPSARAVMAACTGEAASVAAARGIELPYPAALAAVEAVARRTADNRSSMLQDVLRGAPTEVDDINGAIVRAGEALRLPTPVNRLLWMLVKALRKQAREGENVSWSES
jgi:2-dehydropantoate 2-reductase